MAQPTKQYMAYAYKMAVRYGISWSVFFGLIRQESDWSMNSISHAHGGPYVGLTQVNARAGGNVYNWRDNIRLGAQELAGHLRTWNGNIRLALAAYNAGDGAVRKYGGVPPYAETQHYIPAVLGYAKQYASKGGKGTQGGSFYVNPYHGPDGADQGYDFTMKGPIGAVGRAKIIRAGTVTFKQGTGYIVSYQLLDGPMKGKRIYVMENIKPTVKVGQIVGKGQTIAIAGGVYPYLESGWAMASGSPLAPYGTSYYGNDFYSFLRKADSYSGGGGGTVPPGGAPPQKSSPPRPTLPTFTGFPLLQYAETPTPPTGTFSLLDAWAGISTLPGASAQSQQFASNAGLMFGA